MADISNLGNFLSDVANAIRFKTGNNNSILPINFDIEIYNISSGSGDVKLFDTISNMQNSQGNQEGDLAVVYASSQANITEDTEFQVGTFPETVVLSSAITDYIEVGFIPVESSGMFDCWGSLNSSGFSMNIYSDLGDGMCEIRIQYESSDGLTYTRTEFTKNYETVSGDEMDFGTVIKFGSNWMPANWDDRIGQFILAGSVNFNGLFNYVTNIPNYAESLSIKISELDMTNNSVNYYYTNNYINLHNIEKTLFSNDSKNIINNLGIDFNYISWQSVSLIQNNTLYDMFLYRVAGSYPYFGGNLLVYNNLPKIRFVSSATNPEVYQFCIDPINNSLNGSQISINNINYITR